MVRVPQAISVTGLYALELGTVVEPPWATGRVSNHEMGRQAAQMLSERLNGGTSNDSVGVETTLCLRGSLGVPGQ